LEGFGKGTQDHRIRVENRETGAGVRVRGDQPLCNLIFWSIRTTLCPEPHMIVSVQLGRAMNWKTGYEFYTLLAVKR
jgi:hypothetical protein